jgi:septal ring factor EnvC (AmiA/AmiB activator)
MNNKKTSSNLSRAELLGGLLKIVSRMMPFTAAFPEIYDLLRDLGKQRDELDVKIIKAHNALKETSQLLAELEAGLKDRTEKFESIKAKYEQYSKLAEIEENKAAPLMKQIEFTVSKGRGKERTISLVLNIVAGIIVFVVGILVGPKLTAMLVKKQDTKLQPSPPSYSEPNTRLPSQ